MKFFIILFTLCVCGFGMMLSVKRALDSYRIKDWYGILGQTFIFTAAVSIAVFIVAYVNSILP